MDNLVRIYVIWSECGFAEQRKIYDICRQMAIYMKIHNSLRVVVIH